MEACDYKANRGQRNMQRALSFGRSRCKVIGLPAYKPLWSFFRDAIP